MELISFIQLLDEGYALEYILDNEKKINILTNVAEHVGDEIYKFRKPQKGSENNKFIIKYSGNLKSTADDRDIAHYILKNSIVDVNKNFKNVNNSINGNYGTPCTN